MQRQRANVFLAFPQGRQADRDHIQAVEQITPKGAALHVLRQVAVGGRHHAHLYRYFTLAAQPHQRAFLQRAQQLGLQGQRHVANFIQKNRALVGLLKPACPGVLRAGEGPALVAKQLGLKQRVRNRSAVHLDEGLVTPLAGQMHGPGKQLLAGARFAQQQHAGRGLGHALQLTQRLQQCGAGANDPVARGGSFQRAGEQLVFGLQGAGFVGHQRLQLQQLPGQRGQNFQHRHVIRQLAVPASNAVAGQHTNHLAVDFNRQRNKGHHVLRQLAARHRPHQKLRLGVNVLHDDRLRCGHHAAGDALTRAVAAQRHLGPRQPVGIANGGRRADLPSR